MTIWHPFFVEHLLHLDKLGYHVGCIEVLQRRTQLQQWIEPIDIATSASPVETAATNLIDHRLRLGKHQPRLCILNGHLQRGAQIGRTTFLQLGPLSRGRFDRLGQIIDVSCLQAMLRVRHHTRLRALNGCAKLRAEIGISKHVQFLQLLHRRFELMRQICDLCILKAGLRRSNIILVFASLRCPLLLGLRSVLRELSMVIFQPALDHVFLGFETTSSLERIDARVNLRRRQRRKILWQLLINSWGEAMRRNLEQLRALLLRKIWNQCGERMRSFLRSSLRRLQRERCRSSLVLRGWFRPLPILFGVENHAWRDTQGETRP